VPTTLAGYRARHAHYRRDPDLQRAHAACPWVMVWDDHEVENDYARDRSPSLPDPVAFHARRTAAYRAYYEHLPLPHAMAPGAHGLRLHTRLDFGALARLYLLDGRQYRSYQPCAEPASRAAPPAADCRPRTDPGATYFGEAQEAWLAAELTASRAAWNLFGQQTLIAPADAQRGSGESYRLDGWDGYPAARTRLLDTVAASDRPNPVFFGGDVHSFWAADLKRDFSKPAGAPVASEFVTTSIASYPIPPKRVAAVLHENPHFRFGAAGPRGYLRVECRPDQLAVDMRALADVTDPETGCETLASFVVETGRPGPQQASG
jgi:alkaline phosphatase D